MPYFNQVKNLYSKKKQNKRKTLEMMNIRELIKIFDRVFSEYIRLKYSDDNGYCQCITCGNTHHWKDIHNGHYISREVKATRFDERNCRPQCCSCNSFHEGRKYKFRQKIVEIYGIEEIELLEHIADTGGKYDAWTLQRMIIEYREKVKQLKLEKGF